MALAHTSCRGVGVIEQMIHFHFLRPEWLLLAPGLLVFERLLRTSGDNGDRFHDIIDPELLEPLRLRKPRGALFNPNSVLIVFLALLTLVMAGPTWRQQPSPLAEDAAPLIVVLDISESMATTDIAPSRLGRGIQKIRDLLQLVPDKQIGIIAYAGSAHTVLPLTTDHDIAQNFLNVLNPSLAPRAGKFPEYALPGVDRLLRHSYYRSSVLLMADGLGAASPALIRDWCRSSEHQLLVFGLGDPSPEQSTLPLDRDALSSTASSCGGRYFDVTIDTGDVKAIASALSDAYKIIDDEALPWLDSGYPLVFPMLVLALLWFRRGWTRLWVWLLLPCLLTITETPVAQPITQSPAAVMAGEAEESAGTKNNWLEPLVDGFASLWLTPDQYGRLLMSIGHYERAAGIFRNPVWRATARYYNEDFQQAAALFTRQDSDVALFNEANARAHRRDYVGARARYDLLLQRNPDFPGANDNRMLVHVIIEAGNRLSESQAEEAGVGSEEIDTDGDPQVGEGADTLATEPTVREQYSAEEILASPETAELWMNNVQPNPANFLRSKFSIQLQERGVSEQ